MHAVTRELKIALLIGFCLVLVVSVLIADHLSAARNANLAEASGERMPLVHDPLAAVGDVTPGTGITPGPLATTQPVTPVFEPVTTGTTQPELGNAANTPEAYAMVGALPVREPVTTQPAGQQISQPGTNQAAPNSGFQPYTLVQGSGNASGIAANDGTSGDSRLANVISDVGGRLTDGTIELPVAMKTQLDMDSVHGTPVSIPPAADETYTVKSGDNLYKIAKRIYGNGEKWRILADANKDKISKNGNLQIGTILRIPAEKVAVKSSTRNTPLDTRAKTPGRTVDPVSSTKTLVKSNDKAEPVAKKATTYTVKPGDSLGQISKITLGTSKRVGDIIAANRGKLLDEDSIQVGMVLQIPAR